MPIAQQLVNAEVPHGMEVVPLIHALMVCGVQLPASVQSRLGQQSA
jgi:hypothetical protein